MRTKRQKIELELALEPAAKGEARSAGARGTEARTARADPNARWLGSNRRWRRSSSPVINDNYLPVAVVAMGRLREHPRSV